MNPATAQRLVELNHEFYEQHGESFSATRGRLQPGVMAIISRWGGDEDLLDLGCGNGGLARELRRRRHRGRYLGLDFSLPLLQDAQRDLNGLAATFLRLDITQLALVGSQLPIPGPWEVVTCFAVLHHIPGEQMRASFLKAVFGLLGLEGRLYLSNWQFLNSNRLLERIQSWEQAGISEAEVDKGDYLLDWRRDGTGLRYAHHFSEEELVQLAEQAGFRVMESFLSDGEGSRLGLYQTWEKK